MDSTAAAPFGIHTLPSSPLTYPTCQASPSWWLTPSLHWTQYHPHRPHTGCRVWTSQPAPSAAALAEAQATCPDIAAMRQSASLSITSQLVDGVQLFGNISTGTFWPLFPHALQHVVFHSLH